MMLLCMVLSLDVVLLFVFMANTYLLSELQVLDTYKCL